jgi:hypothetical protein
VVLRSSPETAASPVSVRVAAVGECSRAFSLLLELRGSSDYLIKDDSTLKPAKNTNIAMYASGPRTLSAIPVIASRLF